MKKAIIIDNNRLWLLLSQVCGVGRDGRVMTVFRTQGDPVNWTFETEEAATKGAGDLMAALEAELALDNAS